MSTMPLDPKHRRKSVYRPDPLGRLGQGDFVEQRDPFGRLPDISIDGLSRPDRPSRPPSGGLPTGAGYPGHGFPGHVFVPPHRTLPVLSAPVGRTGANDPADVAAVEQLLGQAEYLDLDQTDGPTGYFGFRLEDAIRCFQKDHGLKVDGTLLPEGPTLASLHQAVPAAVTQELPRQPERELDSPAHGDSTVQQAAAPAIIGGFHVGRTLWPYIAGGAITGVAGSAASRQQQRRRGPPSNSSASPMSPAPALPPLPPSEPSPDRTPPREEFPGIPLPPTDVPGFTPQDVPNLQEVYPEQQVTARDLTLSNRRGSPATQAANKTVRDAAIAVADEQKLPISQIGGAGEKETFLRPPSRTGTTKGGSYLDVSFQCGPTRKKLHVNTVDTRADGRTPSTREGEAAARIIRNKESGDILVLLPKPPTGRTYDAKAIGEFLRPYLIEICEPGSSDGPNTRQPILPKEWPLFSTD